MKTRHTGRLQLPPLEKEAVQRHASLRRLPSRGRAPTGSEYMRQAIADGADIEEDMDEEVYEEGEGEAVGDPEAEAEAVRPSGDERATADAALLDGASPDEASAAGPQTHAEERAAEAGLVAAASAEAGAESAVKAEAGAEEGGVEAGADATSGQVSEQAGSGEEPPLDADSEGTLPSDRGQPGSTALSRAESSLGDDDAPSADDAAKASGASGAASQAGEAPRAANGQQTITPDEILDMHVAHFRDRGEAVPRKLSTAETAAAPQGWLAAILRVQPRAPNGAASSAPGAHL